MQNTTPIRSNMGRTHLNSLQQSCPTHLGLKTRHITSGNLESKNASTTPFPKPPTERVLPRMAKVLGYPKTEGAQLLMQILATEAVHYTDRSPCIMCNNFERYLLELKAPNLKERALTDGSYITNKENGSQSSGVEVYHPQSNKITTVNPKGTASTKT
jgi:hypothetical protein